jgi:hypothetical protein
MWMFLSSEPAPSGGNSLVRLEVESMRAEFGIKKGKLEITQKTFSNVCK